MSCSRRKGKYFVKVNEENTREGDRKKRQDERKKLSKDQKEKEYPSTNHLVCLSLSFYLFATPTYQNLHARRWRRRRRRRRGRLGGSGRGGCAGTSATAHGVVGQCMIDTLPKTYLSCHM
jgi:hypothetical protein